MQPQGHERSDKRQGKRNLSIQASRHRPKWQVVLIIPLYWLFSMSTKEHRESSQTRTARTNRTMDCLNRNRGVGWATNLPLRIQEIPNLCIASSWGSVEGGGEETWRSMWVIWAVTTLLVSGTYRSGGYSFPFRKIFRYWDYNGAFGWWGGFEVRWESFMEEEWCWRRESICYEEYDVFWKVEWW